MATRGNGTKTRSIHVSKIVPTYHIRYGTKSLECKIIYRRRAHSACTIFSVHCTCVLRNLAQFNWILVIVTIREWGFPPFTPGTITAVVEAAVPFSCSPFSLLVCIVGGDWGAGVGITHTRTYGRIRYISRPARPAQYTLDHHSPLSRRCGPCFHDLPMFP